HGLPGVGADHRGKHPADSYPPEGRSGFRRCTMMVRSSVLRAVSPRRAGRTARRGALLLEALVSLALLVFGMAYVGLQISNGMRMAREAEIGTKAVMLADTKLAELR